MIAAVSKCRLPRRCRLKLAYLIVFVLYCWIGLFLPVLAGSAEEAFDRKDFATALRLWKQLAANNDSEAQIRIGAMYADGMGVERNYETAANFFGWACPQR